jgi:hypothetical protein
MIQFLSDDRIMEAIQRSLSEAKRADFAVACWGKGATKRLRLDKSEIPVRILCDLTSMACNPKELAKLLRAGADLRSKDGLHAKAYITPNVVIAGFAHASINGLGTEGDESDLNLEAAIRCSDEKVVAEANEWFENHWGGATPIDKNWLALVKPFWRPPEGPGLLSLLARNSALFAHTPIRLVVFESTDDKEYDYVWSKVRHRYAGQARKERDARYPFYIDHTSSWNIKPSEFVVSYWVEPLGRKLKSPKLIHNCGGTWRVRAPAWIEGIDGKRIKVILADEVNLVHGLKFPHEDYIKLERCVRYFFEKNPNKKIDRPILIDVKLARLTKGFSADFRASAERPARKRALTQQSNQRCCLPGACLRPTRAGGVPISI